MKTVAENAAFGGVQGVYSQASEACGCEMTFAVYLPPQARRGKVPVLWYLSGLTCTHENAMTKAGAQGWAADEGIAVIFSDTSPRGEGVADDPAFDLGQGAGFYVDATQKPWAPPTPPRPARGRPRAACAPSPIASGWRSARSPTARGRSRGRSCPRSAPRARPSSAR